MGGARCAIQNVTGMRGGVRPERLGGSAGFEIRADMGEDGADSTFGNAVEGVDFRGALGLMYESIGELVSKFARRKLSGPIGV